MEATLKGKKDREQQLLDEMEERDRKLKERMEATELNKKSMLEQKQHMRNKS